MPWHYVSESVMGTGHKKSGLPCQDSCAVIEHDGNLILVVSDGASSSALSHHGSQLLVNQGIEFIKQLSPLPDDFFGWKLLSKKLVKNLIFSVVNHARTLKCEAQDLAATFLLAVVNPNFIAGVQVGDGGIVYSVQGDNDFSLLCKVGKGEYANQTFFCLPGLEEEMVMSNFDYKKVNRIALISDGLQSMAMNMQKGEMVPFPAFFNPLFKLLTQQPASAQSQIAQILKEFLQSSEVSKRTEDDKTLVMAYQDLKRDEVAKDEMKNNQST